MKKFTPSKSETALLDPFVGLPLAHIHVPTTRHQFGLAIAEIRACGMAGFDTESKPTFVTGDVSEGPHIVQFALHRQAFLFQLRQADCAEYLVELLQSGDVLKVGFGLQSDRRQIRAKLGIKMNAVLDLNTVFREEGYEGSIGVRAAVGIVLKQRFHKSKKTSTSNWARAQLTEKQLLYAANDAFAALKVFEGLDLPLEDVCVTE